MRRFLNASIAVLFALFGWISSAAAQSKSQGPQLFVDYQPPARSFALVIGNDNYPGHELRKARSDATRVGDALRKHGFAVDVAHDLTSQQLRAKIRDFLDYKGQYPDARLLLWFAGHGATIDIQGESHGFLMPVDSASSLS